MLTDSIVPLPPRFEEYLQDYCEKARAAIETGKHHDHRRHLLLNFLSKALDIEAEEFELEHKVKAVKARGRIDAFYRYVIFEIKTRLEAERETGKEELKKYFESQTVPTRYVGVITDGLRFEVYDYDVKTAQPELVRKFELEAEALLVAFHELDELLTFGQKIPPHSEAIVLRFGPRTLSFSRSRKELRTAFELVKEQPSVQVKFREWNALLSKVYGSSPNDEDLFIKHTYLTMISRAIVATALYPSA